MLSTPLALSIVPPAPEISEKHRGCSFHLEGLGEMEMFRVADSPFKGAMVGFAGFIFEQTPQQPAAFVHDDGLQVIGPGTRSRRRKLVARTLAPRGC